MDSGFNFNVFSGAESGWEKAFAVIAILTIGWLTGKLIKKAVHGLSILNHKKANTVATLLGSIAQFIVLIISMITALKVSELDGAASSILAGAGIIGIALGFALQDITSNLMAGIILSVQKDMEVGDLIRFKEYFGRVQSIDLRMTQLKTQDGQLVYIPNKELLLGTVEDYSHSGLRRVRLPVGVAYNDNLDLVKAVTVAAIQSTDGVETEKPIDVFFTEFGESSINLVVMFWVRFEKQYDWLSAQSSAIEAIKKAYTKHRITIPYPTSIIFNDGRSNPLLSEPPKKPRTKKTKRKLV